MLWRLCLVPILIVAMQLDASAARLSKRGKPHAAHRAGSLAVKQIRPGLAANAILSLEAADQLQLRPRGHRGSRHRLGSADRELPGALLVAPNPHTAPVLAELGIPAIDGVPPIAVLNPGHDRTGDRAVFEAALKLP
jgi:hypothetical protein